MEVGARHGAARGRGERGVSGARPGGRWQDTRDAADALSRGLFRTLTRVEAGAPAPLLPGGTPCIQARPPRRAAC